MSQNQLLGMLLVTACLGMLAVKALLKDRQPYLAFLFAAIPTCGWLAFIFGR
jgi:hypothetical protein